MVDVVGGFDLFSKFWLLLFFVVYCVCYGEVCVSDRLGDVGYWGLES